MHNIYFLF